MISSVGYCDDTVILASSMKQLRAMNAWTCRFFTDQNFKISVSKTYVTGRHENGDDLGEDDAVHWPQDDRPLTRKSHAESVAHLGLMINMDLDWKD